MGSSRKRRHFTLSSTMREFYLIQTETAEARLNSTGRAHRGVMWCPVKDVTADGYDMQFGTNVVGHFLLTQLLLPALLKGKATSGDDHARVVTTSSPYAYVGHIDFDTFKDGPARQNMSTEALYQQSKLADIIVSFELARRYGPQGVVSVTLHPGILKTDLLRHTNFVKRAALVRTLYLRDVTP